MLRQKTLKAVAAINSGRKRYTRAPSSGEDIFKGWLRCANPSCNRLISYDPKEKTLKTGEKKVYHLYCCPNDLKLHEKRQYLSEEKIWQQFEPAIDSLEITKEFAKDIADALNETHLKQKAAIKKQNEGFKIKLQGLGIERTNAVKFFVSGKIDETAYSNLVADLDRRQSHYVNELERLNLTISDEAMVTVKKVFELAINAKTLWKSMNRPERLDYLKKVVSNQTLDGLTVRYQLQNPFARLASWKENEEWRREIALFRTEAVAWAA